MWTLKSASYSSAKEKQVSGFVYLSLVYDNNSTVKSIRKVLMSVETRQNESKRDNVGQISILCLFYKSYLQYSRYS